MSDTIYVQLPPDMSALHVMNQNKLRDGDRVEGDWICHTDGTRTPFFTTSLSGIRVKQSTLSNLKALEARVFPWMVKVHQEWIASVKALNHFSDRKMRGQYKGRWYEYCPKNGPRAILYCCTPPRAYNSSRIPEMARLMERSFQLGKWKRYLQQLLYQEIQRRAHQEFGWDLRSSAVVVINERRYLLQPGHTKLWGLVVVGIVDELPVCEVE